MLRIKLIPILLLALLYSCAGNRAIYTISLSEQDDATLAVLKTLQDIEKRGGNAEIRFESGVYNFYPEFAFEKHQFYTNHGDYLTRYAFFLSGMDNVTIDGHGTKFIFHGVLAPFVVEDGENIEIKNLTIDYAYPLYSEGKIVAADSKNRCYDMEISDDFSYEIRDGELIFLTPYYEFPIGQNYAYDPATRSVAYMASSIPDQSGSGQKIEKGNQLFEEYGFDYKYGIDPYDFSIRQRGTKLLYAAEELRKGLVRIYPKSNIKMPKVGWVMVMKGRQGYNRLFAGFKFESVKNLALENITLHHAAGMGYLFENCENTDMYRCKLIPSGDRLISATADATHYVGCRGKLSMRDCVMQSQLDDGTNIHGAFQSVERAEGEHTLLVRSIHHQQFGFVLGRRGDKISLVDPLKNLDELSLLTLESVERLNSRYQLLTFAEPLPKGIRKDLLLENITAQAEVLIENSNFSRNRARALLISTAAGTVIRNNYFSVEMSGVMLLGPGYEYYWAESGFASNVLIEGNKFENCGTGKKIAPSIMVRNGQNFDGIKMKNINIKGNNFIQSENYILQIDGVQGVNFEGNTMTSSHDYPQQDPTHPAISIANCEDLKFSNNRNQFSVAKVVDYLDDSERVDFR
ncbi:MAG: right-handed parallel beta-helix repeat-containing protein [Rikenellaceae bacterium]